MRMRQCALLSFSIVLLLFAMPMAWAGCAAFDDAVLPIRDGGTTNDDGVTSGDAGCPTHRIDLAAPPPTAGGVEEIVVAVRDISLGLEDGGTLSPTFGYDLDHACTCKPDQDSCVRSKSNDAGPACDGDEGRDDATGGLMAQLATVTPDPATYANQAINTGVRGILIRITGYNGEANDSEVKVSLYRSLGTYDELADGDAGASRPPTWGADEKWSVDIGDLVSPPQLEPKSASKVAFVKDQKLVAELATSSFPFNSDAEILLNEVALTADLKKVNGRWGLENAMTVGRWPVDDALRAVMKVQDPQDSTRRLCESNPIAIAFVRGQICGAADISPSSSQDNKGALCSAMSTAVGFRATPALLGAIVTPNRNDPCAAKPVGDCPK